MRRRSGMSPYAPWMASVSPRHRLIVALVELGRYVLSEIGMFEPLRQIFLASRRL
jgi:hypothetical protein